MGTSGAKRSDLFHGCTGLDLGDDAARAPPEKHDAVTEFYTGGRAAKRWEGHGVLPGSRSLSVLSMNGRAPVFSQPPMVASVLTLIWRRLNMPDGVHESTLTFYGRPATTQQRQNGSEARVEGRRALIRCIAQPLFVTASSLFLNADNRDSVKLTTHSRTSSRLVGRQLGRLSASPMTR